MLGILGTCVIAGSPRTTPSSVYQKGFPDTAPRHVSWSKEGWEGWLRNRGPEGQEVVAEDREVGQGAHRGNNSRRRSSRIAAMEPREVWSDDGDDGDDGW